MLLGPQATAGVEVRTSIKAVMLEGSACAAAPVSWRAWIRDLSLVPASFQHPSAPWCPLPAGCWGSGQPQIRGWQRQAVAGGHGSAGSGGDSNTGSLSTPAPGTQGTPGTHGTPGTQGTQGLLCCPRWRCLRRGLRLWGRRPSLAQLSRALCAGSEGRWLPRQPRRPSECCA